MQFRHALVCLLLVAGCSRHAQQPRDGTAQKQAGPGTTLFIQGEKGCDLLPIQNDSDRESTLNRGSGPVTDATTASEIAGAKVEFEAAPGTQPAPAAPANPKAANQPPPANAADTSASKQPQ